MSPEEIKALRNRLGLTQENFARRLGVTLGTESRWENGKSIPSPLANKELAKLFEESKIIGVVED